MPGQAAVEGLEVIEITDARTGWRGAESDWVPGQNSEILEVTGTRTGTERGWSDWYLTGTG